MLRRVRTKLDANVWLLPSALIAAAVALSVAAEAVDGRLGADASAWYLFRGGPEGARSVLSVVASSVLTFSGVVFSVTILVLQLASNQFSPRVLRNFLRDRGTQAALGIFAGTFLYALLGLRSVRGASNGVEDHVPALTVWLAVVLAALCVATFIYFIHHVGQSIRAVRVLQRIGDEARAYLGRLYPEGLGDDARDPLHVRPGGAPAVVLGWPHTSGVVIEVDEEQLWACASAAKVVVGLVPRVGDFVPHGGALIEIWGDAGSLDREALLGSVSIGLERNVSQDVAFAIRELVDVAERALSPGVNDPTTAVQALDQIHDILRRLVRRRFPAPYRVDDGGALRLVLPRPDWEAYVALAVDEIRQCGEGTTQVARRLRFLLTDLLSVAPPFRRGILLRELALLDASVRRGFPDDFDRAVARRASPQGHGDETEVTRAGDEFRGPAPHGE